MTNYERWLFYLKDYGSPKLFKEWGFYSMISSAMQRRVYFGSDRKQLFLNLFIVFVSPAGIGKGMVLGEIESIFRHPRLKKLSGLSEIQESLMQEMSEGGGDETKKQITAKRNQADLDMKNMMIPLSPNATTFEGMCDILAKCASPLREKDVNTGALRVKYHSSLCVHLEELGSLFRRHTEDINTLLCQLFDCKDPYQYRPKNAEMATIRYPCVSILAGATPDFLKRTFASSVLNEGFGSRTIFVYAAAPEFKRFGVPTFTTEQIAEWELLVDHIALLTKVSGPCSYTPEAYEYMKAFVENPDYHLERVNKSVKLDGYYNRKDLNLQKLSAAVHFGDNLTLNNIGVESCMRAQDLMARTEETMHLALTAEARNPLSHAADLITKYIKTQKQVSRKTLYTLYFDDLPGDPSESLETILKLLRDTDKIKDGDKPNTYLWIEKE